MATEVHRKVLLATGAFTISTVFNSLADEDAAQTGQVDDAALEDCEYADIWWEIATHNSVAPDDQSLLETYYAEADEHASEILVADDPLGTAAAAYTTDADVEKLRLQCDPLKPQVVSNDTGRTWRWKNRIWRPAKKLIVVLINATGQALHSSGHAIHYKGYGWESQ